MNNEQNDMNYHSWYPNNFFLKCLKYFNKVPKNHHWKWFLPLAVTIHYSLQNELMIFHMFIRIMHGGIKFNLNDFL
jgi:hypothetical protein